MQRLTSRFNLTNAIVFAGAASNAYAVSKIRTKKSARPEPHRDLQDAIANAKQVISSSKEALKRAYELIEESRRARVQQQLPTAED